MDVETIKTLYAWAIDQLKQELALRNVRLRANANTTELIELLIADMLRYRAAAASGARLSGNMSVDSSGKGKGKSSLSGKLSVGFPFGFEDEYQL